MTDTTYKWGTAPGEYKSQEDAQRAKTKQKLKSRRIRKGEPKNQASSIRAANALSRTFKQGTVKKWGNIARSIATQLRSAGGSGTPVRGAGKQSIPGTKVEIPKKLTKSY